jgi:hypothetical protein
MNISKCSNSVRFILVSDVQGTMFLSSAAFGSGSSSNWLNQAIFAKQLPEHC